MPAADNRPRLITNTVGITNVAVATDMRAEPLFGVRSEHVTLVLCRPLATQAERARPVETEG